MANFFIKWFIPMLFIIFTLIVLNKSFDFDDCLESCRRKSITIRPDMVPAGKYLRMNTPEPFTPKTTVKSFFVSSDYKQVNVIRYLPNYGKRANGYPELNTILNKKNRKATEYELNMSLEENADDSMKII